MSNKFIRETSDKFDGSVTREHKDSILFSYFKFQYRHLHKKDQSEVILLDYVFDVKKDVSDCLDDDLIMKIVTDGGVVSPKRRITSSDRPVGYDLGPKRDLHGVGYFKLSQQELKQICDSGKIEIQITETLMSGEKESVETDEKFNTNFKIISQQFYNGVIDESAYLESLDKETSACFIATATMGSYDHPIVLDFRDFRDNILGKNVIGKTFIQVYYKLGRIPAIFIAKNSFLRLVSLNLLIKPLHKLLKRYISSR